MKAAVFGGKREISLKEVPIPKAEPGSVVIKVKACGICGTDLHFYRQGSRNGITPGHEFTGDIYEVGEGVADLKKGDRVVAVGFRPCGECYWCKKQLPARCSHMKLVGEHLPGAMAEYVLIPNAGFNRTVYKLPSTLSYEEAACVEPFGVGSFSVRRSKVSPDDTVAVIGAGIIGLGIIQLLKAAGVKRVLASARRPARIEAAKKSGADLVIDASKDNATDAILKATGGLGADVVFECAGQQETFDQSIAIARGGGKVVLVALYEKPLSFDPLAVDNKNLTLLGILGGHFPSVLDFLNAGKINPKILISHRFPLAKAKEAFETSITAPDAIKVMLTM
jgi:2-desacetyl-2-hydroxyethyl bacteriochlorophyllide A dehydrogenase